MKHSKYNLAAAAALVLTGTASAADRESREARQARYDNESTVRHVAKYPFRAARTMVRTPLILGQTVIGRRSAYSDRGFFTENERDASLTMRRVPFAGDQPDND